jgi:hypothetical protein
LIKFVPFWVVLGENFTSTSGNSNGGNRSAFAVRHMPAVGHLASACRILRMLFFAAVPTLAASVAAAFLRLGTSAQLPNI